MPAKTCIYIAQTSSRLGDIQANLQQLQQSLHQAQQQHATLTIFPQMALTGHALHDWLLYTDSLTEQLEDAHQQLCQLSYTGAFLIGLPQLANNQLFNGCALYSQGQLVWQYRKQRLSTSPLMDESRYFSCAVNTPLLEFNNLKLAVALGDELLHADFLVDGTQGLDALITLHSDPFYLGRSQQREAQLAERAQHFGCPLLWVNAAGVADEQIYAGHSCVFDAKGLMLQRAAAYEPDGLLTDLAKLEACKIEPLNELALTYQALVCAVRGYAAGCGFQSAILGLSGGIDSALVLAIAVDALGAEQVSTLMMPYHYTAQISRDDAAEQARRMGVAYHVVPVADIVQQFSRQLQPLLSQWPAGSTDTTEQNLQARSRGCLLMALSNRSGALLLSTSNKSEMAVGYCTLYGDMAGGFAPLKDVPKTLVYKLARYRNSIGKVIPERVISRPPSAELAPEQQDTDNLPPYPLLDEIIRLYVEERQSIGQMITAGLEETTVRRIVRLIDISEYKRRQAAIGPRITQCGFGRERSMPLACKPARH